MLALPPSYTNAHHIHTPPTPAGPASRESVLNASVAAMVAWFHKELAEHFSVQHANAGQAASPNPLLQQLAAVHLASVGTAAAAAAAEASAADAARPAAAAAAGARMRPVVSLASLRAWMAPLVAEGEASFEVKGDN